MTKSTWIKSALVLVLVLSLQPISLLWLPRLECLLVIFWALHYPKTVQLGFIFVVGFLMDLFQNSLIGVHALGLVLITSCAYLMRFRFAFYPLWQQSALVGFLTLIYLNLLYWIHFLGFHPSVSWHFWASALSTGFCWPILIRLDGNRVMRKSFPS